MKNIDVCILVGGFGTRLKPILKNQPKVLSKFLGNPILSYILDQLIEDGFRKVCLLTGYKSDEIKEFYGNRYKNLEIFYSEEEIPLGTGGAVKFFSKRSNASQILVLNGDTLIDVSRSNFIKQIPQDFDAILGINYRDTSRYGKLECDSNQNLIKILEKNNSSQPGLINSGTYLIQKSGISSFSKDIFSLEKEYFPLRVSKRKIKTIIYEANFLDIGIPEDYYKAENFLNKFIFK
tara:strand:+ start:407 stop:1111 length:705 start_codon:yes stop_codon:yes gene_type:complete